MLANTSLSALPAVLLDAITFHLLLRVSGCGPHPLDAFRQALVRAGVLKPGSRGKRMSLSIPRPDGGKLDAELFASATSDGFVLGSGSTVRFNPMRMLRRDLGAENCGGCSLDRNDNVVGATEGRAAELLTRQLVLVGGAMDAFVTVVEAAFPGGAQVEEQHLWLSEAEACLDLEATDPLGLVQRLANAPLTRTTRTALDRYRRQSTDLDGVLVVRWWQQKTGPAFKAYAKRADLVRVEIACPKREALVMLLGHRPQMASVGGDEAVELLLRFARAAEPELARLVAHVRSAETEGNTSADLVIALLPLTRLASGEKPNQGRPPNPETFDAARQALASVLDAGSIDLARIGRPDALVRVLRELAGPGGPLAQEGRRAIFVLRPEYASALG